MSEMTLSEALRRINEVFSQTIADFKHWCLNLTIGELIEMALGVFGALIEMALGILIIFTTIAVVGLIELSRSDTKIKKAILEDIAARLKLS